MLEQEKHIFEAMEHYIDPLLGNAGIDLSLRPLLASLEFVKTFVVKVSHGNKDAPHNEPWFAIIYHHVRDWYEKTYGAALDNVEKYFLGVAIIRSLPYLLRVPQTRRKIETEGESFWLIFPSGVDDEESPFDWLINPPNIDKLSKRDTERLDHQIRLIASSLRQICLNIETSVGGQEYFSGFISGILTELENAATNIVKNTTASLQIAVWSIQMAIERALKAASIQIRGTFRESHDLYALFDDLGAPEVSECRKLLNKIPRSSQAISARYGQSPDLKLADLISSYMTAIEIIRSVTALLERNVNLSNFGTLIQKPQWLELPRSGTSFGKQDR